MEVGRLGRQRGDGGAALPCRPSEGGKLAARQREPQFGSDWTERKLQVIAKYLRSYTIALKKQKFYTLYVDAFAGAGYWVPSSRRDAREERGGPLLGGSEPEETRLLLQGSARRALDTDPPFDRYVFIEQSVERCAQLEALREDFPALADHVEIRRGDANAEIQHLCEAEWQTRRAVLFLDPFGLEVDWVTVAAIAATRAIDLWLLFPLSGVNRLLRLSGEIPEVSRRRLDRFFGTAEWYKEFYSPTQQLPLFDPKDAGKDRVPHEEIGRYFMRRLRETFAGVAESPAVMRNSRNSPLYLLCFAVANPRGRNIALRIASHLLGGMR